MFEKIKAYYSSIIILGYLQMVFEKKSTTHKFLSVDVQTVAQMRKVMKGKMKTKQISALLEMQISIFQMTVIKQLTKILNSLLSHTLVCSTK